MTTALFFIAVTDNYFSQEAPSVSEAIDNTVLYLVKPSFPSATVLAAKSGHFGCYAII